MATCFWLMDFIIFQCCIINCSKHSGLKQHAFYYLIFSVRSLGTIQLGYLFRVFLACNPGVGWVMFSSKDLTRLVESRKNLLPSSFKVLAGFNSLQLGD